MCCPPKIKLEKDENPGQPFPKVLQALARLERNADIDYRSIKECLCQTEEIETILHKLTNTHCDSENYANYLFERTEQLSEHFETYRKIIGKVSIGSDVQVRFQNILEKIAYYLEEKIEFKSFWIESLELIESSQCSIRERIAILRGLLATVETMYEERDYFELTDLKVKFEDEVNTMNELVECCFNSSKRCKVYTTRLHDNLLEMESCFQAVVKESMSRIVEIKHKQLKK